MLIELNTKFDLRMTCRAHGWINLDPFQWLDEPQALRWPVRLGNSSCVLTVTQADPQALEVVVSDSAPPAEVEQCVRRVLMLEWNAAEAALVAKQCDSRVASIVEAGGGRMLRGSTAFEDIVKTICTINTSWQNTQRMVRRLVGLSEVGAFPLPSEIMRLGEDRLRREASVGYRASTIIAVARIALECDLEAIELQRLREVRGLGPYAVDHIAVLRGDYSRIPIDSKVRTYCAKHLGIADPDVHSVNEYFSDWGKYRFLGYKFGRIARRLNWIGG